MLPECAACPSKGNRVSLDAEGTEDGSEREIEIEQNRPLLDVQFEIGGGVLQFFPGIFDFLEINAVFLQRLGKADAIFVLQTARLRPCRGCPSKRTNRRDFFQSARLLHPPNRPAAP